MRPLLLFAALFAAASCAPRTILPENSLAGPYQPHVITVSFLKKNLRPEHPRLYINKAELLELKGRIDKDPVLRGWYEQLEKSAEAMLTEPVLERKQPGPRLLDQSRLALKRISTLSGLYLLDGDVRKANRAKAETLAAVDLANWNPHVFLDSAEMSHAVAIGYDWLYSYLTVAERRKIRDGLLSKGLTDGRIAYAYEAWWTKADNNWNQVCNAGLAIAALAVADERPEIAAEILDQAHETIPVPMATLRPDGGYAEGPMYWNYGLKYNVYYLAAMTSALGTDLGQSLLPGFGETGFFRIYTESPTGLDFNFADANEKREGSSPQMMWLARTFQRPEYAEFEKRNAADDVTIFHLIWSAGARADQARSLEALPTARLFQRINAAVFRGPWDDPKALYVGFKGGDNRVNHGHLDLGSFVFDFLGERWAVDLGRDKYSLPGYFDNIGKRFTYFRLKTAGHNTLLIDDENQSMEAAAPIVKFDGAEKNGFAIADLTAAYRPKAVKAMRGIRVLDRRALLVQDEVELARPADLKWNFFTRAGIELKGSTAILSQGSVKLTARILEPRGAVFNIAAAAAPAEESQQPDVRSLQIHLPGAKERVRIAVLLEAAPNRTAVELQPLASW